MGVEVYTDGACSPNPGPGGWGAVFLKDGEVVDLRSGSEQDTTNNRMELMGVLSAVCHVEAGSAATIVTDSGLVVGWLMRGWKRKDPRIVDLCATIEQMVKDRHLTITWRHIRGHQGDYYNEMADVLSVMARVQQGKPAETDPLALWLGRKVNQWCKHGHQMIVWWNQKRCYHIRCSVPECREKGAMPESLRLIVTEAPRLPGL